MTQIKYWANVGKESTCFDTIDSARAHVRATYPLAFEHSGARQAPRHSPVASITERLANGRLALTYSNFYIMPFVAQTRTRD